MGKIERRIEILKDVLLQIKTKKFKVKQGVYVDLPEELLIKAEDLEDYDAKTELLACTKACKVCAKGSIFLSQVRKENQVKLNDLEWNMDYNGDIGNDATQRVVDLFGASNLNKIEAAFEKWRYIIPKQKGECSQYSKLSQNIYYNYEKMIEIIEKYKKDVSLDKFIKKYPNKTDRLVAIVKNCIRNGGIFKP